MAILGIKCEEIALGNVAAFVVNRSPSARSKALQRGGDHPTFTCSDSTKRQTI
ncbi:MAG: hypothetical protein JWP86_1002 [Phenylobacterium sp.]|nr:hypothetical protein [Phenylobacterium sp.]